MEDLKNSETSVSEQGSVATNVVAQDEAIASASSNVEAQAVEVAPDNSGTKPNKKEKAKKDKLAKAEKAPKDKPIKEARASKFPMITYYKGLSKEYGILAILSFAFFIAGVIEVASHCQIPTSIDELKGIFDYILFGLFAICVVAIAGWWVFNICMALFSKKRGRYSDGSKNTHLMDVSMFMSMIIPLLMFIIKMFDNTLTTKIEILLGAIFGVSLLFTIIRIATFRPIDLGGVVEDGQRVPVKEYGKYFNKKFDAGLLVIVLAATITMTVVVDRFKLFEYIISNINRSSAVVFLSLLILGMLFMVAAMIERIYVQRVNLSDLQSVVVMVAAATIVALTFTRTLDMQILVSGIVFLLVGIVGIIFCSLFVSRPMAVEQAVATDEVANTEEVVEPVVEMAEQPEVVEAVIEEVAEPEEVVATAEVSEPIAEPEPVEIDEVEEVAEPVVEEVVEEVVEPEPVEVVEPERDTKVEPTQYSSAYVVEGVRDDEIIQRIDSLETAMLGINANLAQSDICERLDRIEKKVDDIYELLMNISANNIQVAPVVVEQVEDEPVEEVVEEQEPEVEEVADEVEGEVEQLDNANIFAEWLGDAGHIDSWIDAVDTRINVKARLTFDLKMRAASDKVKEFYNEIKNELLSYGIKSRISKLKENFNKGRSSIARMAINGKTLIIYLAIDPKSIDESIYHQKDVSDKKGVAEMPTMIKIKSKIAVRKVKALLEIITEDLVIKPKKGYVPEDFIAEYTADGHTSVELKGYGYMVKGSATLEEAQSYPDAFARNLIEIVESTEIPQRLIKTTMTLAELESNFEDGEIVDINAIRDKGIGAPNANYLIIKNSESMNKKLKVYANEYDPDAVKMICVAGGESFVMQFVQTVADEENADDLDKNDVVDQADDMDEADGDEQ